jgi:hypothetical protein
MRQDEALRSVSRVTKLDARQTTREQHRPDVQARLPARNTNGHRETKRRPGSGHCKERSEIEVRQRTEQKLRSQIETRRVEYQAGPFTAALRAETDPQTPGPAWALLIRCVVVGTLVGSVSVWIANALPSPPEETSIQASAPEPMEPVGPTANAVVLSAQERRRTPEQNGSSMECINCPEIAGIPAGRLSNEAGLLSSINPYISK